MEQSQKSTPDTDGTSAFVEQRVSLLLERHDKQLDERFTEMQDTIAALANELKTVKEKLDKFSETKAGKVVQVVQETQKSLDVEKETTPATGVQGRTGGATARTSQENDHPMEGAFAPGDVAVDKIFYCGSK